MLLPATCALCAVDDSEPVAVGADFESRSGAEEFLAVRCRRCGLVYLNPRPDTGSQQRLLAGDQGAVLPPQPARWLDRLRRWRRGARLMAWCHGLPDDARILDVDVEDGWRSDWLRRHGRASWRVQRLDPAALVAPGAAADPAEPLAHLAMMVMTLEQVPDPVLLLERVKQRLLPGGRLVVLADNIGSAGFLWFSNRHWGGYDFPRHLYLFDRRSLVALCERAGFRTLKVRTRPSPLHWTFSMRNWVQDWHGARWLQRAFSRQSVAAMIVFALLDVSFSSAGKGALLNGEFRKPSATEPL